MASCESQKRRLQAAQGRRRRRLQMETLESRQLLATFNVVGLADGTAAVTQTSPGVYNAPSLRSAIRAANSSAGDDVINLKATGAYKLTIAGANEDNAATGDLDIKSNITINGMGKSLAFSGVQDRLFQVFAGAKVIINGVNGSFGWAEQGAAIFNAGNLTLNSDTFSGYSVGAQAQGGGIYNASGGRLIANDTTIFGTVVGAEGTTGAPGNNGADGSDSTAGAAGANGSMGGAGGNGGIGRGGAIYNAGGTIYWNGGSISGTAAGGPGGMGGNGGAGGRAGYLPSSAAAAAGNNAGNGGAGGQGGAGGRAEGGGIYSTGGSITIDGAENVGGNVNAGTGGLGGNGGMGGDGVGAGKLGSPPVTTGNGTKGGVPGRAGKGGAGGNGGAASPIAGGAIFVLGGSLVVNNSLMGGSGFGARGGDGGIGGHGSPTAGAGGSGGSGYYGTYGSATGGAGAAGGLGGFRGAGGRGGDGSENLGGVVYVAAANLTVTNTRISNFDNASTGGNGGNGGLGGDGGNGGAGGYGGYGGSANSAGNAAAPPAAFGGSGGAGGDGGLGGRGGNGGGSRGAGIYVADGSLLLQNVQIEHLSALGGNGGDGGLSGVGGNGGNGGGGGYSYGQSDTKLGRGGDGGKGGNVPVHGNGGNGGRAEGGAIELSKVFRAYNYTNLTFSNNAVTGGTVGAVATETRSFDLAEAGGYGGNGDPTGANGARGATSTPGAKPGIYQGAAGANAFYVGPVAGNPTFSADAERSLTSVTGWWTVRGATADYVNQVAATNHARVIDIEVETTSPYTFSATMVANTGDFAKVIPAGFTVGWFYDLTPEQLVSKLSAAKGRLIDYNAYLKDGVVRVAGAVVPNTTGLNSQEKIEWYYHNQTAASLAQHVQENKARIVDLSSVVENGTRLYSAIMVANNGTDAKPWWYYLGKTAQEVTTLLSNNQARPVDIESDGNGLFDVVMVKAPPSDRWRLYFNVTAAQALDLAYESGQRITALEPYKVGNQTVVAAIMVNASSPLANQANDVLGAPKFGEATGVYLKEVGGAVLANTYENHRFEPASMIKVLLHAGVLRQVLLGKLNLSQQVAWYYQPGDNISNTTKGNPAVDPLSFQDTASNRIVEPLGTVLERMMEASDNRATYAIQQLLTPSGIQAIITAADLQQTVFSQVIGGPRPGNFFTLADAGRLYEKVANGTLLGTGNVRDLFYKLMLDENNTDTEAVPLGEGLPNSIMAVVTSEAAKKLGKPSTDAAVIALATQFMAQMRDSRKGGDYTLPFTSTQWHDDHTEGGVFSVAFKVNGTLVSKQYVYGVFIENAAISNSATQQSADQQQLFAARSAAIDVLFRDHIAAALATW